MRTQVNSSPDVEKALSKLEILLSEYYQTRDDSRSSNPIPETIAPGAA